MASTWSALKVELLGTGENSGTWGTLTNANLGDAVLGEAITGSATVDFATDADVTITLTNAATTQSARNLRLNITESSTGVGSVRSLILGSGCQIEKFYLINNTGTGAKTVKNTSGTGISVPAGKATLVYNDGTNVVDGASYFTSLTLGSALPVASGGTGLTSGTSGGVLAYTASGTLASSAALTQYGVVYGGGAGAVPVATANGTTGQAFIATTGGAPSWGVVGAVGGGTGVANNAAMTVTGSGNFAYTRTLTATTNVTFPTTGTLATLAGTETLTNKTLTTPVIASISNSGTITVPTGTDTLVGRATTDTLTNKTLTSPTITNQLATTIRETITISATASTGTIQYDASTQAVLYYTTNASGNFTLNFRGTSGISLNTLMNTGESLSLTFLSTQGSTAYYNSAVTVDSVSVTPKWQGGSAPTSGNASSIDSYTYVIIKTGSAAFTVLAAQTKFA